MAEDRIDSIIDIQAVKSQFATVQGYLDNLALQLKNFQVIPSGLSTTNIQQLTAANSQYTASLQGLGNTTNSIVESQKQLVVMQQQLTSATKTNTESLKENIATRIRVKASMESYIASQKEDLALLKAGTISRSEYNKRLIESNIKIEQYKNQMLVLNKEIKTQTLTTAQQGGAYALLNKEYVAAQLNAKNLAVIYGVESAEAKAAAASALALNVELQAIDKTVGLSQRNVGNYGSVFQRAFGGLRTLANILPGVGISGLLLFAIEPIQKWMTAIKEATGDAKLLNDVVKDAAKNGADQVAVLEVQKSKLNDLSLSTKQRVAVAKEYNETAAEGNKLNLDEINNLSSINSQIEKQIGLIERQSLAKAAQAQISKFAEAAIQAEFELNKALQEAGVSEEQVQKSIDNRQKQADRVLTATRQTLDGLKIGNSIRDGVKQQTDIVEFVDKKLEALLVRKKGSFLELQRVINLLKPELSESTTGKPAAATANKNISDNTEEAILQAQFNINKRVIQLNIDKNKEIAESDKYTIIRRLEALQDYAQASTALVDLELAYELNAEDLKLRKIKENLEEQKKEKGANVKALTDQQEKEEKASAARRTDIESKFSAEKIKLLREYLKTSDDIVADNEKKQQLRGLERVKAYFTEKAKTEKEAEDKLKRQREEAAKQQLALNKQLISELQTTFFAFLNDGIVAQQNQLDQKKRLLDEATARQINQINLLGLTEVERTQRIAQVQKQAAYQTEKIEERKRALAVQQAKYQKAADAASIITSTASAVMKIFKDYKYATALPLAAATAAIGALQLARVLAAPLPKYAKGTSNAKRGFAIAGEIGAELVTERSGHQYLTPDVPTLMHFKGGEKITPANITHDILNAANIKALASIQPKNRISAHDVNTAILSDINRQLVLANRKQQPSWKIEHGIEATPWFEKHFKQ